jgi:hypothetical protein
MDTVAAFFSWYGDLLEWIAFNPIKATIFLTIEFCVLYWIYYWSRENPVLKVVFGTFFQPQNLVANIFIMTLIGLELPREFACTPRMQRWKRDGGWTDRGVNASFAQYWRFYFATTLCRILNKADPGHC